MFKAGFNKIAFNPMGLVNTAKKAISAPGALKSIGTHAAIGAGGGAIAGGLSKDENGDRRGIGGAIGGAVSGGLGAGLGSVAGRMGNRLSGIKNVNQQRASKKVFKSYGTHGQGD